MILQGKDREKCHTKQHLRLFSGLRNRQKKNKQFTIKTFHSSHDLEKVDSDECKSSTCRKRILHFHFLPLLATFLFFIQHYLSGTYKNHR